MLKKKAELSIFTAEKTGKCLKNRQLQRGNAQVAHGISFIEETVRMINDAATDEALLNLVIDRCIEYTGATSGSLMIVNGRQELEMKVVRGFSDPAVNGVRLKVGEGITGWVAGHGEPYLCNDTGQDPRYYPLKNDVLSEAALPMQSAGHTFGVINLDSDTKAAFTVDQLEVLKILAATISLVYGKMCMIEALQHKVDSQTVMLEIAEVLNHAAGLNEKFHRTMALLQNRLGMERGTIVLESGRPGSYAVYAAAGLSSDEIRKGVFRKGEGVTGKILQTGESVALRDLSKEPGFLYRTQVDRRPVKTGGQQAFFGVPIKMHGTVVGVLSVDKCYDERRFDEDLALLKLVASFLGQAIQVEEAERQRRQRLIRENTKYKEEMVARYSYAGITGGSPAMQEIYSKIEMVAASEATVLVTGESGTGKELVADAIHRHSKRRGAALVKINCAAIPETMLEAELFGYRKGSFTGAGEAHKGKIRMAHGGTLFLDEIGDMPLAMQTKLLRVIQEREVDQLGGELPLKVDVRIIAATSRDLEKMVRTAEFREDLYYRLNVFRIDLPPLRKRREDIELIARAFLHKLAEREGVEFAGISYDALAGLEQLPLPGNVRELQNLLEQAFLIAGKGYIEEFHLQLDWQPVNSVQETPTAVIPVHHLLEQKEIWNDPAQYGKIYQYMRDRLDRMLIADALQQCSGNQSEAARLLGINRNTLMMRQKKFGL